jgi:prepilin-type N-terminal cleavage/methylation domain-containing protein
MRRTAPGDPGMTLVELMIVVVVISILAAIAVVGYRKYIASARVSEATAMLAEFAAKEQLYFLDNGLYHPLGVAEAAASFHPHNPDLKWDSAREAFPVNPIPTGWVALGVRPRWRQLFCTYFVTAGPTEAIPAPVSGSPPAISAARRAGLPGSRSSA